MGKLVVLLLTVLPIFNVYAKNFISSKDVNCPYQYAINTDNWWASYQQPEAKVIRLVQIVNKRYLIMDHYSMVIDVKGSDLSKIIKGTTLWELGIVFARKGDIEMQTLNGFTRKMELWVPVTYKHLKNVCPFSVYTMFLGDNR